jgi:hypothetical protein
MVATLTCRHCRHGIQCRFFRLGFKKIRRGQSLLQWIQETTFDPTVFGKILARDDDDARIRPVSVHSFTSSTILPMSVETEKNDKMLQIEERTTTKRDWFETTYYYHRLTDVNLLHSWQVQSPNNHRLTIEFESILAGQTQNTKLKTNKTAKTYKSDCHCRWTWTTVEPGFTLYTVDNRQHTCTHKKNKNQVISIQNGEYIFDYQDDQLMDDVI